MFNYLETLKTCGKGAFAIKIHSANNFCAHATLFAYRNKLRQKHPIFVIELNIKYTDFVNFINIVTGRDA